MVPPGPSLRSRLDTLLADVPFSALRAAQWSHLHPAPSHLLCILPIQPTCGQFWSLWRLSWAAMSARRLAAEQLGKNLVPTGTTFSVMRLGLSLLPLSLSPCNIGSSSVYKYLGIATLYPSRQNSRSMLLYPNALSHQAPPSSSSTPFPSPAHFITRELHHTKFTFSITFAAFYLLQRLKTRIITVPWVTEGQGKTSNISDTHQEPTIKISFLMYSPLVTSPIFIHTPRCAHGHSRMLSRMSTGTGMVLTGCSSGRLMVSPANPVLCCNDATDYRYVW